MSKIQEQREAARVADEKVQKRKPLELQDDKKIKEAPGTRKSTRTTVSRNDEPEQTELDNVKTEKNVSAMKLPSRPKTKKNDKSNIADYFKKHKLDERSGGPSVAEALEQAAGQDAAGSTNIGAQELRSARQPDLVTGGVMRGYQLEGLEWLTSLYENGLNGILADEMGLGKTIQTISFLAFLRSKRTYGPFLIAAPLSTLSNWVDEFARWTPEIPVILYHGTKQEREDIRRTKLVKQGSPDFPVVCTSYEICMNDRKYLSNYGWKFIIIVSGNLK